MTHHDPRRPNDPTNAPEPVVHDAAPVRSGKQARQAPPGRPVLYVLIAGLILAVVAWAAVGLYPRGETTAQAPSADVTGSTPSSVGGIPLSPPAGSPEGSASDGQTAPGTPGRGQTSAPSPSSDSAR